MSLTLNYGTIRPANIAEWLNSFVVLPTFESGQFLWRDASELIMQFNYTATKNFTLRELPTPPVGVNFCLVIRYRIGLTTYRYKLWTNVNEVLNEPIYNGEVIKKNFVLEIWSVNVPFFDPPDFVLQPRYKVSLNSAINIKLSIRKIPDTYASLDEYADNTFLDEVTPTEQVIVFGSQASPPTSGLAAWYKARDGGLITDLSGNGRHNTGAATFDNGVTIGTLNRQTLNYLGSGAAFTEFAPLTIYVIFKVTGWSSGNRLLSFINFGGTLETYVEQITGSPQARGVRPTAPTNTGSFNITLNREAVLGFIHNSPTAPTFGVFELFDLAAGFISFNNFSTDVAINNIGRLGNMTAGNTMNIAEILMYTNLHGDDEIEELQRYLTQEYFAGVILTPGTVNEGVRWLDNS